MSNKTFIVLSEDGTGVAMAMRLQSEGCDVIFSIKPEKIEKPEIEPPRIKETSRDRQERYHKEAKHAEELAYRQGVIRSGDGLLKSKQTWDDLMETLFRDAPGLKDSVVIVFDMNHNPDVADKLRSLGYKVVGSGKFCDDLEHKRKFGLETMKMLGIQIPPGKDCKDVAEATAFLKSPEAKDKTFVFKPDDMDCSLTFVGDSNEEMIEFLESVKDQVKKPFLLQEKIKGTEISVDGWFNGERFICFDCTFERKKIIDKERGENCGCSGDFVFRMKGAERVVVDGLLKIEPLLKEIGLPLLIDLNQIVTENGLYAIEFTPRFGYDSTFTWCELLNMKLSDFLDVFAQGGMPDIPLKPGVGGSVLLYRNEPKMDMPISFPEEIKPHVWLWDATINEKGKLVTIGKWREIMVVTGYGNGISEAAADTYKNAEQVVIPDLAMRSDIGKNAKKSFDKLTEMGWL